MATVITKEKIKETVKKYRSEKSYIRQDYMETNGGNYGIFVTIYDAVHKIGRTLTNEQHTMILNSYEGIDKKINVFDWIFYSVMLWIEWDLVGQVEK